MVMLCRNAARLCNKRFLSNIASTSPVQASIRNEYVPPRNWTFRRPASSSSRQWRDRQGKDVFAREARVQGLKSRAAFKLLQVCPGHERSTSPAETLLLADQ